MIETQALKSAEEYTNRGKGYLNSGDYDRAIGDFDLAIKLVSRHY